MKIVMKILYLQYFDSLASTARRHTFLYRMKELPTNPIRSLEARLITNTELGVNAMGCAASLTVVAGVLGHSEVLRRGKPCCVHRTVAEAYMECDAFVFHTNVRHFWSLISCAMRRTCLRLDVCGDDFLIFHVKF